MQNNKSAASDLDNLILEKFPQTIAKMYRKLIDTKNWQQKTYLILETFEYTIRTFAVFVISQYLQDNSKQVKDPKLTEILQNKFLIGNTTLGTWVEIVFSILNLYDNKPTNFAIKELFDWYWNTSNIQYKIPQNKSEYFHKMVKARNEIVHGFNREGEDWEETGSALLEILRKILSDFSFIENYDLLVVNEESGRFDNKYWYKITLLSGEKPIFSDDLLYSSSKLSEGCCYLSKKPNIFTSLHQNVDLINLHPWVIVWEDRESFAAIFDRIKKNSTSYILPGEAYVEKPIFDSPSYTMRKALDKEQKREPENEIWDVFISHSWEDKEGFVRPLANALQQEGLKVWFDEFTLKVGDSLSRSIDRGLANSRYGIIVLSPSFFTKEWTQKELGGLISKEVDGSVVILPIWHNIDVQQIRQYSPILADKVATKSELGIDTVVNDLLRAIR